MPSAANPQYLIIASGIACHPHLGTVRELAIATKASGHLKRNDTLIGRLRGIHCEHGLHGPSGEQCLLIEVERPAVQSLGVQQRRDRHLHVRHPTAVASFAHDTSLAIIGARFPLSRIAWLGNLAFTVAALEYVPMLSISKPARPTPI